MLSRLSDCQGFLQLLEVLQNYWVQHGHCFVQVQSKSNQV